MRAWTDGRIFSNLHGDGGLSSFVVLGFNPPPMDYVEHVGLVYEHIEKAAPRAVNGMPTFFSCRFLHKLDLERARPAIEAIEKAKREISL